MEYSIQELITDQKFKRLPFLWNFKVHYSVQKVPAAGIHSEPDESIPHLHIFLSDSF
jgi:hypothetical protein